MTQIEFIFTEVAAKTDLPFWINSTPRTKYQTCIFLSNHKPSFLQFQPKMKEKEKPMYTQDKQCFPNIDYKI